MSTFVAFESLESRGHCAASAALDPNYLFSYAAIKDKVGEDFRVFEAVPTRGDRTFLLADRDESFATGTIGRSALLTIIAVTKDGKLDASFGDGGVALTGRRIDYLDKPGRLAVDGAGRVYFADNTRVVRLRRNGTTDRTFGTNGAAGFAPANRPVQLCDLLPIDDGVLVATTRSFDGGAQFAVQKIGRDVDTVWQTQANVITSDGDQGKYTAIAPALAQFAASGGNVVLAHVRNKYTRVPDTDPDAEPGDTILVTSRQDVTLTRFDAAGRPAGDAASAKLQRPASYSPTYGAASLGTYDYRYPNYGSVLIDKRGRNVTVQTDQEILRFDLKAGTLKRAELPGDYRSSTVNVTPDYRLLSDGGVGVIIENYDKNQRNITELDRFSADGTHDASYDDSGVFVVKRTDYATQRAGNVIDQIFLGSSGRMYFLSTGTITGSPAGLTLRRLIGPDS